MTCTMLFLLTVSLVILSPVGAQPYISGCGVALQDVPNPSSDTCTAFFRCYNNRQFSLRCPLGQAFHYDRARCRPENEVDCPLQLQRYQAPAVPPHLRSPQDRDVEVRVIHLAPGVNPNNLQFFTNGQQVQVTNNHAPQRGGHTLIAAQQQNRFPTQNINAQQPPTFLTSPDVQNQPVQGQVFQGLPSQGQIFPGQQVQGQVVLGHPGYPQLFQGTPVQTQGGQPLQGQTVQGNYLQPPVLAQVQG
ncbi:unnamed protein product [Candidula unifasciata]|uniref:Chitin-binding type-2 domain-containing protein n=1 Tax=Candidula unifasciata TaxID=100452 RepID=A0A8S3ZUK7_9EUPU|nr:unnamed protein product [Candidula unifasciata]